MCCSITFTKKDKEDITVIFIGMSFLQFMVNGVIHTDKLTGDNDLHFFDIPLTNIYLDKFNELIGQTVTYDDIIAITLFKNDDVITRLPNNLKYLSLKSATLKELPINDVVAPHLEVIQIQHSNLEKFPNVSKCSQLKEIKINNCNLLEFNLTYELPPTLKTLDLCRNSIHALDFTLFPIDPKLKIQLSYNRLLPLHVDHVLQVCKKASIHMQGQYTFHRIDFQNINNIEIRHFMQERRRGQVNQRVLPREPIPRNNANNNNDEDSEDDDDKANILKNNTQTVHLTSINKTIRTSYANILKYIKDNHLPTEHPSHWNCIRNKNKYTSLITIVINEFTRQNKPLRHELREFLQRQSETLEKHSMLNITYIELLNTIWSVIDCHEQRENLIERLHTELSESIYVCFTGRMNRLINVLVGYVEGVVVSISLKEELQMSIQIVMNNYFRLYYDVQRSEKQRVADYIQAKKELCDILNANYDVDVSDPNNIISDEYKQSWLSALQDYRPEPKMCSIQISDNGKKDKVDNKYWIAYDGNIYQKQSDCEYEVSSIGKVIDEDKCFAEINGKTYPYDLIE